MSSAPAPGSNFNPVIPQERRPSPPSKLPSEHAGLFMNEGVSADFRNYYTVIRRHLVKIVAAASLITILMAIHVLREPKLYESSTIIRLDASTPQVESVNGNPALTSNADVQALLATDKVEIQSPAVVIPSILAIGLQNYHSNALRKGKLRESFIKTVRNSIQISQPPGTFLMEIHYRSVSPDRAAAMANQLAQQFMQHEYATRTRMLRNLASYMSQQLISLRARMEQSQLALNHFETANGISDPKTKFDQMNQRLTALTSEYDADQAKLRQLETNLMLAEMGNTDALLVSDRGTALDPLIAARQRAQVRFDNLAAQYGPRNYLYLQAQGDLKRLDATIAGYKHHVIHQMKAQYQAQKLKVHLTLAALNQQKRHLADLNAKAVQFAILQREADADRTLYDSLLQHINNADISAGYHSNELRIVAHARPIPVPVAPQIAHDIIFTALFALLGGVLLVMMLSTMDRTLTSPEAVRLALREDVIGSLPNSRSTEELSMVPLRDRARRSQFAEAISSLRTALLLSQRVRSLVVTSSQPQEGKSTVAAALANSMALQGLRTILIDADIRRPSIHRLFDLPNLRGLSSVLNGECTLAEVIQPGKVKDLGIITAGPTVNNPSELLTSHLGKLVEELQVQANQVIIDTPPLLGFADALAASATADAVIMVVRAGYTPRDMARSALDQLNQSRANIAGIVLNAVTKDMHPYYYSHYDSKYYRSYNRSEEEEAKS